jgi:hypothetical protein
MATARQILSVRLGDDWAVAPSRAVVTPWGGFGIQTPNGLIAWEANAPLHPDIPWELEESRSLTWRELGMLWPEIDAQFGAAPLTNLADVAVMVWAKLYKGWVAPLVDGSVLEPGPTPDAPYVQ